MKSQYRYEEFDSIRGIASIIVLFHHSLLVIPHFYTAHFHQNNEKFLISILTNSPIHILWAGHEMVILFFVLSGFVLSLAQINGEKFYYKKYLIKRICRIYIPYVFILVFSYVLYKIYINFSLINNNTNMTSIWFNGMWSSEIHSIKLMILMFLMSGYGTHNLNTVTWSLVHEMRISIFLPFLVMFINKKSDVKTILHITYAFFALILLWIFCVKLSINFSNVVIPSLIKNIGYSFYYAIFFLFGILLAKYQKILINLCGKMNYSAKIAVFFASIIGITNEWNIPKIGLMKYSELLNTRLFFGFINDFITAISVFLLFILVLSSKKISRNFRQPMLLYLGKISFSLYLVHPIILMSVVNALRGYINMEGLIFVSITTSIFFAHYLQKYLEVPTIRLGEKLTSKSNEEKNDPRYKKL